MADIFREIDEDVRRDRALDVWKKHGNKFIDRCPDRGGDRRVDVLQKWQLGQSEAAGARYEEALQLAKTGKAEEAEAAFTGLAKDAPSGYATLARFRAASETAKADSDKGLKAYEALAADSTLSPLLRDMARLRAWPARARHRSRARISSPGWSRCSVRERASQATRANSSASLPSRRATTRRPASISTRSSPTRTRRLRCASARTCCSPIVRAGPVKPAS